MGACKPYATHEIRPNIELANNNKNSPASSCRDRGLFVGETEFLIIVLLLWWTAGRNKTKNDRQSAEQAFRIRPQFYYVKQYAIQWRVVLFYLKKKTTTIFDVPTFFRFNNCECKKNGAKWVKKVDAACLLLLA